MFFGLFSKKPVRRSQITHIAEDLYSCAMLNTREEGFFKEAGVPDTFDGRFDLLLVHIFIIFHILMAGRSHKSKAVLQALFDRMFDDMDQTLREMGAGDIGVSRQVKRMMDAFNGRIHAYQEAVSSGNLGDSLQQVLMRNLYGTHEKQVSRKELVCMEAFVTANITDKSLERVDKILQGHILFDNSALNREKGLSSSNNEKIKYDRINKS